MNGVNPVISAVDRTRGEVLKYQGRLVRAVFHSNAGGHTEDSENVWVEALPYLRGVPSPADAYAESYGGWAAESYKWTKTISRKELEAKLEIGEIKDIRVYRNITKVSKDPVSGKLIREFVPGTYTVSGRATEVTVIGSKGTKSYYRDEIRSPFGLKSTLFDLILDGRLRVLNSSGRIQSFSGNESYVLKKGNELALLQLDQVTSS